MLQGEHLSYHLNPEAPLLRIRFRGDFSRIEGFSISGDHLVFTSSLCISRAIAKY